MSSTKTRDFLKGILSYSLSNVAMYFLSMVSIPFFINYFGISKYGVWSVLMSLISYLSNSQFGLGTVTSILFAKTEDVKQHKVIFNRVFEILIIISSVLSLLGLIFYFNPEAMQALFGKVPADLVLEATKSLGYLYLFFLLRLPFVVITSAFVGHQDVQLERLYVAVLPQVLNFLAIVLVRWFEGDLVSFAIISGAGNLLIALISALHYFLRHKYLYVINRTELIGGATPGPTRFEMLRNGGAFFIAGLSSMIIMNTDNLILSHFFGSEVVANYSLTYKVFLIGFSIFFIFNSALWPMFGRAYAKNEVGWIKSIFSEASINFPLVGGLIWLGGVAFMRDFLQLWIGSNSDFSGLSIVFALGGYGYVASVINFQTGLLSSVNVAKPFMKIGMLEALVNLVLSIVLCQFIGPQGVAYGTFVAAVITSFVLIPRAVKKYIHTDLDFSYTFFFKHFFSILLPSLLVIIYFDTLVIKFLVIAFYIAASYFFIPKSTVAMIRKKINWPPVVDL